MLNPKTIEILSRHKGEKIYAINVIDNSMKLYKGKLVSIEINNIIIHDEFSNNDVMLSYMKDTSNYLRAIYNTNNIELLTLKQTPFLSVKLKNRDNMANIISRIKPNLGSIVALVFSRNNSINLVNGELSNMGMMDIVVKPAPFFNSEEKLSYNSILHIFDKNGYDLIAI